MPTPRSTLLALLALAGAHAAGAQVTTREVTTTVKDPALFTRAPIASVSFTPYQMGGVLEGRQITAQLSWVTVVSSPNRDVVLRRAENSSIELMAGLADGIYSVRFSFTLVTTPATVTIRDQGGVLATCSLQAQSPTASPQQTCEATGVQVTGGQFRPMLQIADGDPGVQLWVGQITVSRYR
jgi:hypothetical protein